MFAKRNAERAAKEQKRKIEEELSLLHMLSEEHDEDSVFLNKAEMRKVYQCNDPNTLQSSKELLDHAAEVYEELSKLPEAKRKLLEAQKKVSAYICIYINLYTYVSVQLLW